MEYTIHVYIYIYIHIYIYTPNDRVTNNLPSLMLIQVRGSRLFLDAPKTSSTS